MGARQRRPARGLSRKAARRSHSRRWLALCVVAGALLVATGFARAWRAKPTSQPVVETQLEANDEDFSAGERRILRDVVGGKVPDR